MDRNYFRNYLNERGIKIGSLAKPLGCVPQHAYNVVDGRREIKMDGAFKLKSYLRMTDDEFKKAFQDEEWFKLYEAGK